MTWTLTLAALMAVSGSGAQVTPGPVPQPSWHLLARATAPLSATDPQHVGFGAGLRYAGTFRTAVEYQPTERGRFGMLHASLGVRVLNRDGWHASLDAEHTQVRASRRLFDGSGWQLDGHDRHQLSLVTTSVQWHERRVLGWITGIEVGGGRLHIWRLVSAQAAGLTLSASQDPILESSVPVGMIGLQVARPLPLGLVGHARVRLIGAGHSRGGEIPFAHVTGEWEVSRTLFRAGRTGSGRLGVSGTHASSLRAATYFQNGAGLTLRIAF